jgi:hypothetical protein
MYPFCARGIGDYDLCLGQKRAMEQQQGYRLRSFQHALGTKNTVQHVLIGAHHDID